MFRSPPVQLVLALTSLALSACAEDRSPTQPESGAVPASPGSLAAALAPNTWTLKAARADVWCAVRHVGWRDARRVRTIHCLYTWRQGRGRGMRGRDRQLQDWHEHVDREGTWCVHV